MSASVPLPVKMVTEASSAYADVKEKADASARASMDFFIFNSRESCAFLSLLRYGVQHACEIYYG